MGLEDAEWGEYPIVQTGATPYKGESTAPAQPEPGAGNEDPEKLSPVKDGKTQEELLAENDKKKKEDQKKKEIEDYLVEEISNEILQARG
jgi:hypothetical protein